MGVFSKLFGRRTRATAQPRQAAKIEKTPADEQESEAKFDPEATIFISPKIPVIGQQAMRKLREFEKSHITRYNWQCGDGCRGVCQRVQKEGPYKVADGLAGLAPVPGMGAYRECNCAVVPVKG